MTRVVREALLWIEGARLQDSCLLVQSIFLHVLSARGARARSFYIRGRDSLTQPMFFSEDAECSRFASYLHVS